MDTTWLFRWRLPEMSAESATLSDIDDLDQLLAGLEFAAATFGTPIQVDLFPLDRFSMDPLLVQFVVGGASRNSLVWHADGECFAAVQRGVAPPAESLQFAGLSGYDSAAADDARLLPGHLRELLIVTLLTPGRPRGLDWHEMTMD